MNEPGQKGNRRYQRYAPILLAINGCAVLAIVMLVLWFNVIHPHDMATGLELPIVVVSWLWCIFGLPITSGTVAIGSLRRLSERKAKAYLACAVLLLVFWVLLVLACL